MRRPALHADDPRSRKSLTKKRGLGILVVAAAAVMALAPPVSGGPAAPNFDLQGILRPVAAGPDKGFGVMESRQPKDADKTPPVDRRRPDRLRKTSP